MLSKIDFFISKMHEPCKVSERDWYITIFNPDGSLLNYCNKQYLVIKAECGHASIVLPPGKYVAMAVWNFWQGPDGAYWGNHFTHKTIFQTCCNGAECVWMYNPSVHECGMIFDRAVAAMRPNLNQTEADLIDAGVNPSDPRFAQLNNMKGVIDTNQPALQAMRAGLDQFFDVFLDDAIKPGNDINRDELMGLNQDPAQMDELVTTNSIASTTPNGDYTIHAQLTGTVTS
jgi:hypothetical protein